MIKSTCLPDSGVDTSSLTTAQWFEIQIRDHNLAGRCTSILRKRFPKIPQDDMLSHVGMWFAKWASTGMCDSHLAAGKPPGISVLIYWLTHKFHHRTHSRAQDALHRWKGVRTQLEVRNRKELEQKEKGSGEGYIAPEALKNDPEARQVSFWAEESGLASKSRSYQPSEIVAYPEDPLRNIIRSEGHDLARDLIRVYRAKAATRYTRYLDHLLKGTSKEEVALLEGDSSLRVTHMLQKVRGDLRAAPVLLEVALKILVLVSEEPWSTREEIRAEVQKTPTVKEDPNVGMALKLLSMRGLLTEGSHQSFAPTDAGRCASRNGSLF